MLGFLAVLGCASGNGCDGLIWDRLLGWTVFYFAGLGFLARPGWAGLYFHGLVFWAGLGFCADWSGLHGCAGLLLPPVVLYMAVLAWVCGLGITSGLDWAWKGFWAGLYFCAWLGFWVGWSTILGFPGLLVWPRLGWDGLLC